MAWLVFALVVVPFPGTALQAALPAPDDDAVTNHILPRTAGCHQTPGAAQMPAPPQEDPAYCCDAAPCGCPFHVPATAMPTASTAQAHAGAVPSRPGAGAPVPRFPFPVYRPPPA